MNITFSFSRALALAESRVRFSEFYDLGRSYKGIPKGTFWSVTACQSWLEDELEFIDDESDYSIDTYVSVRGQTFFVTILRHSIEVQIALVELQRKLGQVHRGECSVSDARKARKTLDELLDRIEW